MQNMLVGEVALFLRKSPSTVRWYADSGKIPFSPSVGGVRIFQRADVERFARKQEREAKNISAPSAA
jgi:DNA-binding transcriptional MerR regulator